MEEEIQILQSTEYSRKLEYLFLIEEANAMAQSYSGTENEHFRLFEVLQKIEELVNQETSIHGKNIVEREEIAAELWQISPEPLTLSKILQIAHDSQKVFLQKILSLEEKESLEKGMVIQKINGVILPTKGGSSFASGSGAGVEAPRFEERLVELLHLLEQWGIFSDDIILTKGKVDQHMVRAESYVVVEIPRLSRMVLVCDQVGEASFVVYGFIPSADLLTCTKEELQQKYPSCVQRVERRNVQFWTKQLQDFLFTEESWNRKQDESKKRKEKLPIYDIVQFREQICLEFTVEEWVKLTNLERKGLEFGGMGLKKLSRKFGIEEGNPVTHRKVHLELGRKIYGDHPVLMEELKKCNEKDAASQKSLQDWIIEIQKVFPDAEGWVGLDAKERQKLKFFGVGLTRLGTIFGVLGDPLSSHKIYLELAKKIYGDTNPVIVEALAIENMTKDQWVEEVKQKFPNANMWINLTVKQARSLKFKGVGLHALATSFGIVGSPVNNRKIRLELGKKIYGDDLALLEALKTENMTVEDWVIEIKKIFPDPKVWVQLTSKEKGQLKFKNVGLTALVTIFGLTGDPIIQHKIHLELAKKVYGDLPIIREALEKIEEKSEALKKSPEDWKQEIKEKYADPKVWIGMGYHEKRLFRMKGVGLHAIATIFGVKGNPVGNSKVHLELGIKIYDGDPLIIEALRQENMTVDEWIQEIKKNIPDKLVWMSMTAQQKRSFRVLGIGLVALATIFGIKGNPLEKHSVHLQLGEKIYG